MFLSYIRLSKNYNVLVDMRYKYIKKTMQIYYKLRIRIFFISAYPTVLWFIIQSWCLRIIFTYWQIPTSIAAMFCFGIAARIAFKTTKKNKYVITMKTGGTNLVLTLGNYDEKKRQIPMRDDNNNCNHVFVLLQEIKFMILSVLCLFDSQLLVSQIACDFKTNFVLFVRWLEKNFTAGFKF